VTESEEYEGGAPFPVSDVNLPQKNQKNRRRLQVATSKPTVKPTYRPTFRPTSKPSTKPTVKPTVVPSKSPFAPAVLLGNFKASDSSAANGQFVPCMSQVLKLINSLPKIKASLIMIIYFL